MAIIKCKMCGGDLEIVKGSSVCECTYCGTKQTVPSADNEKKLTLFSRAGRLLRACEFDKASGVFETIVADFPEEAEAYWGLVLCKYGIEYVDDPATGKKIPTCHRSSFDSVLDDANFEQACENTDAVARRVYRDEARHIEELRQAILQVSGKEEPYDVFISYKETDGNGERTLDSVIAQDIYKELTGEGYRVFFSRISLEDKLGTEYEPYIFAALNSAKVMIVVGTDYENFDSVWVKNEWSRFLKLIAKGEKKTLIPVFKNMDAYDMPKEFAKLAAQDMGKVGAMQDLVRGVEKLVGKKKAEPAQAQPVQQPVYVSGGPNVTAMIERGHQALEDGEWAKADEFFDQALNMDAKCAEAFLGKFLARGKAVSLDAALDKRLAECDEKVVLCTKEIPTDKEKVKKLVEANFIPGFSTKELIIKEFDFDPSYSSATEYYTNTEREERESLHADRLLARALHYADGGLSERIRQSTIQFETKLSQKTQEAIEREEQTRQNKEKAYIAHMAHAEKTVAEMRARAEERREEVYQYACRLRESAKTKNDYNNVIEKLISASLEAYKDGPKLITECRAAIDEINERDRLRKEAEAKAAAEEAERQRIEKEKAEKLLERRTRRAGIIFIIILSTIMIAFWIVTRVIPSMQQYNNAVALYEAGHYEEALAVFEEMADYKDSEKQVEKCKMAILEAAYNNALALKDAGDYEAAISAFESLTGYKDSKEQIVSCKKAIQDAAYNNAIALKDAGDYEAAISALESLIGYKDSEARLEECYLLKYGEERYKKYILIKNIKVGDTYSFGAYEQDNNTANGKENVEWLVLAKEGDKILVISKYALDCKPYNTSDTDVTWETCSLRKWLNGSFLNSTFSEEERKMIPSIAVGADKNPRYDTNPGNDTKDSIFLLSIIEVEQYFNSDRSRQCQGTAYCYSQGAYKADNGYCWWWLRSPGWTPTSAANISFNGSVGDGGSGRSSDSNYIAVRPAMWIDFELDS